MFINNLFYEKQLLQNIQKHHFEKLYAPDNPSGILLCQKHLDSFRWRRRYLQAGRPVTTNLHKTEKGIAEKLAVNLYRITCIQYLQSQIGAIDNILRQFGSTDNTLKHQMICRTHYKAIFQLCLTFKICSEVCTAVLWCLPTSLISNHLTGSSSFPIYRTSILGSLIGISPILRKAPTTLSN